jgi:hypothetical protein
MAYALIRDGAELSSAASASDTPHSPQQKMRTSVRPCGRGSVRDRCIDRPQFGHSGLAAIAWPDGGNKFCMTNMGYLMTRGAFLNDRLEFKRPFETGSGRK